MYEPDQNDGCHLCLTYRPDRKPQQPDRTPVCEGCRFRLDREIADIHTLHDRLVNPDPVEYDTRRYKARDRQGRLTGQLRRADPLAAVGGVAPIPGRTNQPHVAGSRSPAIPINVDQVDLTGLARVPNPTAAARKHPADQIGHHSAATLLYEIVRDWRDTLWPDQHLPVPTVPELVGWLRVGGTHDAVGVRVDEACDRHPAITQTAAEIRDLRQALRGQCGETEPRPRRWLGVTCQHCGALSQLVQEAGDEYAECGACRRLYTEAEMAEWLAESAARERTARTPQQVAELLRA
jgi:hypothetical protein